MEAIENDITEVEKGRVGLKTHMAQKKNLYSTVSRKFRGLYGDPLRFR